MKLPFTRLLALFTCLWGLMWTVSAQAQATDASRQAFLTAKGVKDPFDLLASAFNANSSHFVRELSGLMSLNVATTSIESNGAAFTVAGTINLPELRIALAGNTAAASGTKALFRKTLQSTTSMIEQVGLTNAKNLPFSLTISGLADNASGSVVATLGLVNGKFATRALPTIGTRLGATSLGLQLGVSKVATGPVTLSAGVTGDLFILPSSHDQWLRLAPAVMIDSGGGLTVGSTVSGSCGTNNFDTAMANQAGCAAVWDVFGLGMLSSKGGSFFPTFDAATGSISAVTAEINDANLGNVLKVSGALVLDADATPGAGLVLNTTQATGLVDTINALSGKATIPAMTKIKAAVAKIPGVNSIRLSQSMQIVVAPFGFVYGSYNYPGATYKYATNINAGGATIGLSQELKGDVVQILRGTGGTPQGSMGISANFSNVYSAVEAELRKAGWLGTVLASALNTFKFNGGSANVGMNLAQGAEATGALSFSVFNRSYAPSVSLDVLFNPAAKLIDLVLDQGKIEVKKIFGMCDPTDTECQRKNRVCESWNTGYQCVTAGWGGTCQNRRVGADNYTCVSPEKEAYDEAKRRVCTQYNAGYACYNGNTKGNCSSRISGVADHYQCR